MGVDAPLVSWIVDYLTLGPQFSRLYDCVSESMECSVGPLQGTVLSPYLFTLCTSDLRYNSTTCHLQKFLDDTAFVGCIRDGKEGEYWRVVEDFVRRCVRNYLQLNKSKTKEMVVDFRRNKALATPVNIQGMDTETVGDNKSQGVHLDNRLV